MRAIREVDVVLEAVEEALAVAEHHRRDADGEQVDDAGRERLPDDRGAAADRDPAVPRLAGRGERGLEAVDEREPGLGTRAGRRRGG